MADVNDSQNDAAHDGFTDRFVSAPDGLRLHVRDYGDRTSDALPVICLPGLTRSVRDFHDLALALSRHPRTPRRVVSFDYRGRGQSAYDRTWENYNVLQEQQDVLAVLTALDIEHAAFIGTSRGGILIMIIAATRPGTIRCAVLNDVGPVIDVQGLLRIKRMLAELKPPGSWNEAIASLKRFSETAFPEFNDADWEKMARQTFRDEAGKPAIDFDRAIEKTLAAYDPETPPPDLWPQFKALGAVPVLAIRGELSGILSDETLAAMEAAHPGLRSHTVDREGHAPTLWDAETQALIADFIAGAETGR